MKNKFTVLLVLLTIKVFSQDILLQQNVQADSARPTYGPNLKNFVHGYIGLGFPFYTNEEANYTRLISSTDFNFGIRYKRKLTPHFATGFDIGVASTAYKLKQDDAKTVPDNTLNDKEKIQVNTLRGSAWLRINVGRRGNFIGNYLDVGGFGGWNFQKKHKTINTNDDNEKVKVSTSRLKYIENFSYGLLARLGFSRYSITANYRLSDLFKNSYSMPELPKLTVGFEIGLFGK